MTEYEGPAGDESIGQRLESVGLVPLAIGGIAVLSALDGGTELIAGAPLATVALKEVAAALFGLAAFGYHWLNKNR
jgi:hypothetical protein